MTNTGTATVRRINEAGRLVTEHVKITVTTTALPNGGTLVSTDDGRQWAVRHGVDELVTVLLDGWR